MKTTRTQTDSFGSLEIAADALWGVHTERSLHFFNIGTQRMPVEIIHAMAHIKAAAATVNAQLGLLDESKALAITAAAQRIAAAQLDDAFPLSVWQTGSGTQSHMNVNEVIATLAKQAGLTVHVNDDVNLGQSSNDVFPSAMHIAVLQLTHNKLLPALNALHESMLEKAVAFKDLAKVGRTHLQDAVPITLGQEFSGYAAQLALCQVSIHHALDGVCALAIGATAVGTGVNTHPEFGSRVASLLATQLRLPLRQSSNLFAALAGHEALVALLGSLRMLAIALNKIGNDIRLMGSGPRAGLGELLLPQNEAGSSIMPGKVNPTQVEALCMVCAQVMGHDVAIGIAASQGQLELNVYKPLIALDVLDSIRLLGDAMHSFNLHCLAGLEANLLQLAHNLERSLMLVTALSPHIGYDRAAQIAKLAQQEGTTLREAALQLGAVSAQQFDEWVDPRGML
ncbi:class II fumarate hydratase [Limnohabitans planktonicus]|uniref:Fumarate hydratase class II n=1 Tax=Limnohabitans planktonicus II-D5 TaxID=1293045 RepID=A0A2T7UAA6_9BURK|nr:class II fumarate hydratase [Limnohabitans planktonicus]PVE41542.1 class II fumarate hydratase [Limnohabitans planktonicus II-D5]|eukprot:gene2312-2266_t